MVVHLSPILWITTFYPGVKITTCSVVAQVNAIPQGFKGLDQEPFIPTRLGIANRII